MPRLKLYRAAFLAPLALAACMGSSVTDTSRDMASGDVEYAGIDRREITIRLQVQPDVVPPGDTVRLVVRAYNSSGSRIQVGHGCGPTMDVRIRSPNGDVNSVLQLMVPPNGAFTCELGPYHFAEAHDSLTERLWWVAPGAPGEYVARAGARGSVVRNNVRTFDDVSEPIHIRVR